MGALISGCAEEVDDAQPSVGGTVTMKTTVSLSENASTRALTEAGVKTFTAGDQIAVVYEQASGTAKAVSVGLAADDITESGKKAAFTVTLSSPKANGKVRYIYPASRAATYIASDVAPDNASTINYDVLATQVGTFDKIASDLDLSVFDGEMTAQAVLPAATLVNPLTIAKFTITNSDGTSDLTSTITSLTINDGTNTYAITRTAAAGPIYVAMKPIVSTQNISVDATDGTNNYTKSVSGNALAASSIYTITVKALKKIDLSQITAAYTAHNGEVLTGTLDVDNYPVKISIADGATVTLNGLTINGTHVNDDAHKHAGITCEGDATIILADGSVNTVRGFHNDYPGIIVAVGKTLTIKGGTLGTGSLNASSNSDGAGIGAGGYINNDIHCGNIEILSGNITAIGGNFGAGIGGGHKCTCGNITISGGIIIATGGNFATGIGAGADGKCGTISISNGTIKATGGDYAAGIGGGKSTTATCGNITINGGTITATSSKFGAGIGGGMDGNCGNIIISGGTITAKASGDISAGYGAGIGGGDEGTCGNITISGGTITATGSNWGAGIGSGCGSVSDSNKGKCGNIIITTSVTKIEVTKGEKAQHSIGKGGKGDCGTVTIGCTLNSDGAPIGGSTGYISDSPYTYQPPAAP